MLNQINNNESNKTNLNSLIKKLEAVYVLSTKYDSNYIKEVQQILREEASEADLLKILEDKNNSNGVRLIAFYALCVKYRRGYDTTDFCNHLEKWQEFQNEQLYLFQQLVFYKTRNNDINDFNMALSIWNENLNEEMKKIPGVIQAYGDMIAKMFEMGLLKVDEDDNNLIKEAIAKMTSAIKSEKYPKYFSTLGRLYAARKDYQLGIQNINIAIDKEDSDAKDYAIRVNGYQTHILQIKIKMLYDEELNKINIQKHELEEIKEAVEKSKYDSLAFLGFFVALISFIFGSFTIAEGLVFVEKVQMILILCGGLILAFSLLRHILKTFKDDNKDTIFMAVGGIILILFALLIVPGLVR